MTKEIFDKKGQIGLSLVEPFSSFKDFDTELEGATFLQTSTFSIPFRSIGIRFQYKFGKLDFQAKQRRSKINNDDLKQDGGNQGQNGGN